MRILIAGGPRTGKSTLSGKLAALHVDASVMHGDDLIGQMDWSELSEEIARWFVTPPSWIIEGVQIARALRKWLLKNPDGKPCDKIYYRSIPHLELSVRQEAMRKGCEKVWNEVMPELVLRGVTIEQF